MAMSVGEKRGAISEINVVPLIDVLLVLIIIFMVITPLRSRGVPAVLPRPAGSFEDTQGPIVVRLAANGSIRINQESAESWESLRAHLVAIFSGRADKTGFVQAEAPVEFSEVAQAIAAMHGAGVEKVVC